MSEGSLRERVLRGGAYLTVRHGLGTVINVAAVLLLTRIVGPGEYGLYAAAIGAFTAVQLASQLGLNVFLLRTEEEPGLSLYHQAAMVLLASGLLLGGIGVLLAPLIENVTRLAGLAPLVAVTFVALPVSNLALVPMARMERELEYRSVTWAELVAQLLFVAVGAPLAFLGWGAWAPLLGWWAQQLAHCLLYHRIAQYRPGWHYDRALIRRMLHHGVGYSASLWLWQFRRLVNPFVVGRFLGAEAVAFVAVATQIVTHLSFVANATWRLGTSALARVRHDTERTMKAINEGMPLQILVVAPFLVAFGLVAQWVVPALLGRDWTTLARVYPYIAVAYTTIAAFNLHCSALYVRGLHARISIYHVAHVVLLLGAALLLVPRFGLIGYGYAELINLASFLVLHLVVAHDIGDASYGAMLPLWAATALLLFHQQLGVLSFTGALLLVLWSRPWRAVRGVMAGLRGAYAFE